MNKESDYQKLKIRGMAPKLNRRFEQLADESTLSPQDVAILVNLSNETVRRWCRSGKLPSYNRGGKYAICTNDFKEFMLRSKQLTHLKKWSLINEFNCSLILKVEES